jgi:hypothetical protein
MAHPITINGTRGQSRPRRAWPPTPALPCVLRLVDAAPDEPVVVGCTLDTHTHTHHVLAPPVYGAWFEQGNGYRIDATTGVAKGNEEESMYMVTSGKRYARTHAVPLAHARRRAGARV